jgi:hypothetical protein
VRYEVLTTVAAEFYQHFGLQGPRVSQTAKQQAESQGWWQYTPFICCGEGVSQNRLTDNVREDKVDTFPEECTQP